MVAWVSSPDASLSAQDIHGRLFDADGTPLSDEFTANSITDDTQAEPTVAALSDGSFAVAWTGVNVGTAFDIFARRFDSDGAALGTEFVANSNVILSQELPTAAATSTGFILAWAGQQADGNQSGIAAQRFDNAGNTVGTEFIVNTYTTDAQSYPAIAVDADDSFVVTWASDTQDGSRDGVYAQRFSAAGLPEGTEFRVNETTDGDQNRPSVSFGQGGFVVAWEDEPTTSSLSRVVARCFDTGGAPLSGELEIDAPGLPSLGAQYPGVAGDGQGDFVVSWRAPSLLQMGGTAIIARRFSTPVSGVCGDPVDAPSLVVGARVVLTVNASDALFVLRSAVGGPACELCVCDVDGSGDINATDALLVLQKGVGQPVVLSCPACT
jgi:hypothetical protein